MRKCLCVAEHVAINIAAVAAILVSGVAASIVLADTYPVPIPKCWRTNCINDDITNRTKCYLCCDNCPDTKLDCMDWCDDRIYPTGNNGGGGEQ